MEEPRKNKWRDSTFYSFWCCEQYEVFKKARNEFCRNFFADYDDEDVGHILRMGGIRVYEQLPEEVRKRVSKEDVIRLYEPLADRVECEEDRQKLYDLYRVDRDEQHCTDETDCLECHIWETFAALERQGLIPRGECHSCSGETISTEGDNNHE